MPPNAPQWLLYVTILGMSYILIVCTCLISLDDQMTVEDHFLHFRENAPVLSYSSVGINKVPVPNEILEVTFELYGRNYPLGYLVGVL